MDNTNNTPTVLSFCTGYGGVERGIERVLGEITVIAHVEIEAYAVANLVDKMETGQMVPAPVWTDIKTFPSRQFYGKVDILTAGYPCQPFSQAGARKGADDPRHLWPYIRKAINDIRPGLCFFENVEGHISLGLSTVISDLEEDGYTTTWGIFSASEVGAPHQRKRVFILAESKHMRWGGWNKHESRSRKISTEGPSPDCGNKLADPDKLRKKRDKPEDREWCRIEQTGEGVADSNSAGQQEYGGGKPEEQEQSPVKHHRWPSRPGEEQYEWEEKRTI